MSKLKKTTLYVKGMHCHSCDVLVKKKFSEVKNIKEVKPHFVNQSVEVLYTGNLDKELLNQKINQYGYSVGVTRIQEYAEPLSQRLGEAGVIAVILFIAYFMAQQIGIVPSFNVAGNLSLTAAFILGLVASTSTCMATSGALFLATVGKLNNQVGSVRQNIVPAISFNAGRVLSYGAFGFIAGMIGKTAVSLQLGSFLTLFVSIMMVLVGLDMLKIFSITNLFGQSVTKGLFEKLENKLSSDPKRTAFFLGAITYLLPCGFTMSVQLYALGLGNPVQSALMMMIFALGTVPALMAIGFASSFTKSSFYPFFVKIMGVLVFMIGAYYFTNFLNLYGVNMNVLSAFSTSNTATANIAATNNGVQEISMTVNASGYTPNQFTVKQGEKVRMVINGKNVLGCQSTLRIPKMDIVKTLSAGNNVIEFTPQEKGTIPFSCIMGMFTGKIEVI